MLDLPENNKKFLQCTCGEGYVICLVENDKGKGVLYAKGENYDYQCGVKDDNDNIQQFTQCEIDENLDFKFICTYQGFSAALTSC